MANLSITVCDSCHALDREAHTWAIHGPESSRKIDLCAEHGGELDAFLDKMAPGSSRPRRGTKRKTKPPAREDGFATRVTTMEELQARKKGT